MALAEPSRRTSGARGRAMTPPPTTAHVTRSEPTVKENKKRNITFDDAACRADFLKKVYGILSTQLVLTVLIATMCMHVRGIREALLTIHHQYESALRWVLFVPTLVSLIILKLGAKDKYPTNYILLIAFTLCISMNVGYVCAVMEAVKLGHLVLQAFGTTASIFLALTMYTVYSGKDFSYMKGFLSVALWGLTFSGFLGWFFPALIESLMFVFVGAVVFCGYILFDTWRLTKQFSYDDYIVATIELYLDVINLFFYILKVLLKSAKNAGKSK